MKNFDYIAAKSIGEAIALLSQGGKVMAGGTDLIVEMRDRAMQPGKVIDLKKIPGLDYLEYRDGEGLRLGALARIRDIETSKVIREKFWLLSEAAGYLGSVQVRNRATVGGNLCHATPSADMAPALIGLGAMVRYSGAGGEKVLPLEDFFQGPGKTVLQGDEILTEIRVPEMGRYTDGVYLKFSPRRAMDLAVVGVASVLTTDKTGSKCEEIRIVLGAVAPVPMRAKKAEEVLRGKKLNETLIREAGKVASQEAKPITDIRASEWYRRQIVEELTVRTVQQAWERIRARVEGGK